MAFTHAVRERLADLFQSGKRDRQLAEEIRFHLEVETEKLVAGGMSASDARAAALRKFGNPQSIREAARDERGGRVWNGVVQDIRWAVRSIRRNAGFTSLSLITLAVGISATTVAFAVLDTVLLRPLPYRDAGKLVVIEEQTEKQNVRPPSFLNFVDWRSQNSSFDGVAAEMYPSSATFVVAGEPSVLSVMGVSRGFFATLGMNPVLGREFTAEENIANGPHVIMVSHEFWRSRLNSTARIDTVNIDGDNVVGVVPPGFRLVGDAQIFYPHERSPNTFRSAHNYVVVARLKPGATLQSARADMRGVSQRLKATYGAETEAADVVITPLHEYMFGGYRTLTVAVFASAALVLLIACTNLVSAQLARGFVRARELGVRTALGASRGQLIRQLCIESAMLSMCGAVLSVLLAELLVKAVRTTGASLVPRLGELTLNANVFVFAALVTALTALLIGIYPALRLSGAKKISLRSASHQGGAAVNSSVWTLLIGFEVALALLLLVGSSLLAKTMHNILTADTGFQAKGVVTAALNPNEMKPAELERIREELAALPGVEGAAYINAYPLSWGNESAPILRPGDDPTRYPALAGFRIISPDYFRVLKLGIVKGREFTNADNATSQPVAIVSTGIANALWPNENPIGKSIRTNYLSKQWLTVVGVSKEAANWKYKPGSQNEIYTPWAQHTDQVHQRLVAVLRTSGNTSAVLPVVRERLRVLAPHLPPMLGTLDARIADSASDRRFATLALGAFAAVAVLLAGIGIYGVVSYSVAARRHEIGIRLALGATPGGVQRFVLRGATTMALLGIAAGIGACFIVGPLLQSLLYGVTRVDPVAYALGAAFLFATAMFGAWLPAARSSRIDPLNAMRGE